MNVLFGRLLLKLGCPLWRHRDKKIAIVDQNLLKFFPAVNFFFNLFLQNPGSRFRSGFGSGSVFSLKFWIRIENQ
jgi:hypothetical protein